MCRKLQTTYWLEPAGSKGVWSLDDYQMLVFMLGSSQYHGVLSATVARDQWAPLKPVTCRVRVHVRVCVCVAADHKHLKPKCIHDEDVLEHFAKDNMYLQAINFIKSVR